MMADDPQEIDFGRLDLSKMCLCGHDFEEHSADPQQICCYEGCDCVTFRALSYSAQPRCPQCGIFMKCIREPVSPGDGGEWECVRCTNEKSPMNKLNHRDTTPRYAPQDLLQLVDGKATLLPVLEYIAHLPGQHPSSCPFSQDCTALEMKTAGGSTWWAFDKVWINSALRTVVSGFPAGCGVRSSWEKAVEQTAVQGAVSRDNIT